MWPVSGLPDERPDHVDACEDLDVVVLWCRRCGWTAPFSAAGASRAELVRTARAHRCPAEEEAP